MTESNWWFCVLIFFFLFSVKEREGPTNKPRRARHWFTRRCGRCLSNTDSIRSSVSSIAQYLPETQTHMYNSTHMSNDANSNESGNHSSSVTDLSSSQRYLEDNSTRSQELRTNCESHASSSSLRSVSVQGYISPYEERRSYTHQVVVVAPITGTYSVSKLQKILFSQFKPLISSLLWQISNNSTCHMQLQ